MLGYIRDIRCLNPMSRKLHVNLIAYPPLALMECTLAQKIMRKSEMKTITKTIQKQKVKICYFLFLFFF